MRCPIRFLTDTGGRSCSEIVDFRFNAVSYPLSNYQAEGRTASSRGVLVSMRCPTRFLTDLAFFASGAPMQSSFNAVPYPLSN